jgi:hypothetical protein
LRPTSHRWLKAAPPEPEFLPFDLTDTVVILALSQGTNALCDTFDLASREFEGIVFRVASKSHMPSDVRDTHNEAQPIEAPRFPSRVGGHGNNGRHERREDQSDLLVESGLCQALEERGKDSLTVVISRHVVSGVIATGRDVVPQPEPEWLTWRCYNRRLSSRIEVSWGQFMPSV